MEKNPENLKMIGEALFGRSWKTALSEEIGHKSWRMIQFYADGQRKIPDATWEDIKQVVSRRRKILEDLNESLVPFKKDSS